MYLYICLHTAVKLLCTDALGLGTTPVPPPNSVWGALRSLPRPLQTPPRAPSHSTTQPGYGFLYTSLSLKCLFSLNVGNSPFFFFYVVYSLSSKITMLMAFLHFMVHALASLLG